MSDDYEPSRNGDAPTEGNPLDTERAIVTPSVRTVFELLADERRREICHFLQTTPGYVFDLADIVDALATGVTEQERTQFAIACHHRHLPKLEAGGIVDYDARSNTVRYLSQPTVEKWVEHTRAVDREPGSPEP